MYGYQQGPRVKILVSLSGMLGLELGCPCIHRRVAVVAETGSMDIQIKKLTPG